MALVACRSPPTSTLPAGGITIRIARSLAFPVRLVQPPNSTSFQTSQPPSVSDVELTSGPRGRSCWGNQVDGDTRVLPVDPGADRLAAEPVAGVLSPLKLRGSFLDECRNPLAMVQCFFSQVSGQIF